jgi:hypothetical protein
MKAAMAFKALVAIAGIVGVVVLDIHGNSHQAFGVFVAAVILIELL